MNSFIFLPRLLSIEPGAGITADRNHRERERERETGIRVYSFELAACFESLNDRGRQCQPDSILGPDEK